MNNIMIDIETLGTKSNSVILSIGAIEFNLETGATGKSLHLGIDIKSCKKVGLKTDPETLAWWATQSEEAKEVLANRNVISLKDALIKLTEFYKPGQKPWGNSSRFDLGLLENAYNAVGLQTPWKHYDERDVRTLVSLAPHIKATTIFKGTPHNPIDDAKFQIEYCTKIYNTLNNIIL